MRKISFRNVILASIFVVYFIFSLIVFLYFNNIYYQNIKEKLIVENKFSAKSVEQFFYAEKETLAQEAKFVVNYPGVYFGVVNNKYVDFYDNKNIDINNLSFEDMTSYKYTDISYELSRIAKKNITESGMDDVNIALFNKDAISLSNVPGIDESFKDTGSESYIQYMIKESNKYFNIKPVGTINSKNDKLFFKGIDRVYSNEPMGVAVVTLELKSSLLNKIKNIVSKEIVILTNGEVQLSTLDIKKTAFNISNVAFNEDHQFFNVFKIDDKDMGYTFFPITDFDDNVIAYAGVGFDMQTAKDIYTNNMWKFVPMEIFSSLLLFIFLVMITKKAFRPFQEIINLTEEINKGIYYIEKKDSKILEFSIIMRSISKMSEAIKHREDDLVRLSTTDGLTGVYNKSKIESILREEIEASKKYGSELSIIIADIDYFKKINDNFGHETGDIILKEVTSVLKSNIRESDFIGRWGGEEFFIICPATSSEEAANLANKIREKAESNIYSVESKQTVSFGVATLIEDEDSKSFFIRVDKALYNAKRLGRNRVEVSKDKDVIN